MSTTIARTPLADLPRLLEPVQEAPVDGTAAVFAWQPLPGVAEYHLQVALDPEFQEPVFEATLNATSFTLLDTLPTDGARGYWRVRGQRDGEWKTWSKVATFRAVSEDTAAAATAQARPAAPTKRQKATTATRARKQSGFRLFEASQPLPITPVEGEATDGAAVLFAWAHVPNADGYQLEVAADAEFSDIRFNAPIEQTHFTLFDHFSPDNVIFYWRVRHRVGEQWEAWTEPATFRSVSAAEVAGLLGEGKVPVPVTPVAGMPVDGSAAEFQWTLVPGATGYRVQVARDRDFRQMVTEVPLTTQASALTLYQHLPEDGARYFWRVAAEPAEGERGWSSPAAFIATSDEGAEAFGVEQEKRQIEAHRRAEWRHYLQHVTTMAETETTSNTEALFFLLTFFFSLFFLVFVLFAATQVW